MTSKPADTDTQSLREQIEDLPEWQHFNSWLEEKYLAKLTDKILELVAKADTEDRKRLGEKLDAALGTWTKNFNPNKTKRDSQPRRRIMGIDLAAIREVRDELNHNSPTESEGAANSSEKGKI